MTAPDPGLTDLIAAHWYNTSTCMCTCGWSTRHLPESDDDTRIGILVARHLALVVEQHTNGRHEWPKTTPTGHTYERPTTYAALEHMIGHMAQSEIECWDEPERPPEPVWEMITLAQREIYRQSVRIAELEERIAEAQSLCHNTGRYNAARQKHWNIRVFACDVLAALKGRAALEGEQQ